MKIKVIGDFDLSHTFLIKENSIRQSFTYLDEEEKMQYGLLYISKTKSKTFNYNLFLTY